MVVGSTQAVAEADTESGVGERVDAQDCTPEEGKGERLSCAALTRAWWDGDMGRYMASELEQRRKHDEQG